jgi:hypothetical protein
MPLGASTTWRLVTKASVLALCLSGVLTTSSIASAQAKDAKARARDLFSDGASAVEDGKPADGLPKLQEAESLFHAPTHVLYIARAQAALGKLIDSETTYKKLVDEKLPKDASKPFLDAQASGKKELADLERRIPKVLVKPDPSDAKGLGVVMNGASLDADKIGVVFPVDPGQYSFEAKADGLEAQKVTVDAAERTTTEVRLMLRPLGSAPVEGGDKNVIVRREDGSIGGAPGEGGFTGIQIASFPMMGVGGAGLVVGGVLVGLHFVRQSDADAEAACAPACTPTEVADIESLDNEAASFGTGGIIALSAGAAIATAGVVMFFVGGDSGSAAAPSSQEAAVRVTPIVGPGYAGVSGTF